MGIGPIVRHHLGRWERPISEAYRSFFIDLDRLAEQLAEHAAPKRILEIGCGEGAFAERLLHAFPGASYLGIDISPATGRGFGGDRSRADFQIISSSELRAKNPEPFDLVLLVDVVHHVPAGLRRGVLQDAGALTAGDGVLAVKDWERRPNVNHVLVYLADRYVTGDRNVAFARPDELRQLLTGSVPDLEVRVVERVEPRSNNILYLLGRSSAPDVTHAEATRVDASNRVPSQKPRHDPSEGPAAAHAGAGSTEG